MGPEQQRKTAFTHKIIVRPCILSTLLGRPCSLPIYFVRAFCPFFKMPEWSYVNEVDGFGI